MMAEDRAWRVKLASEWNEDDARQVLAASPWSQTVRPALVPALTAGQRQAGGASGGGDGQALKTLDGNTLAGLLRGSVQPAKAPQPAAPALNVRWESALPVRVAEMKAREIGAPDWEGDYYVIAIYSVPGLGSDRKRLAGELARAALLRTGMKQNTRPSRVEVEMDADSSMRLVYLFPRVPFEAADDCFEFVAQFGRFSLTATFHLSDMKLKNKLEL
jgi:hypothetical protein